jgi:predicted DNA-binding WGR domain protein
MSDWDVHLVFIEDKSKKFWRARKEGTDLYVNWGRIGTEGQTQLKELSSVAECEKEYSKLVAQKRGKGYIDEGGGAPADDRRSGAPAKKIPPAPKGDFIDLSLDANGRKVDVRLSLEGSSLRTTVVEQFANAGAVKAALGRIKDALEAEGYAAKR